ncbi:sulfotransferase family 2 domain-containing protein [Pseudophaeobacter profundi]|jgi:hypothetical protein|uniref:sulfotransferase family 2 domain-containing protein n=1 Tax=Pseudophaeobacter profundi TaxID=3034152 RepID=UPI002432A484|nr:sulfotransferase family 2 domain-containing protein [Pseudophaeobacter profundi]
MTVILDTQKFFYAAAPKVACSSLKLAFFELENGRPFEKYTINRNKKHIHNVGYRTLLRSAYPEHRIKDYFRTTFVRDPIARLLSAYGNRVIAHKELSLQIARKGLEEQKLEPTPDLDLFVDRLADYQKAHPSILHHTQPLVLFLGADADYFSRIYLLSEMAQFVSDFTERTGQPLTVGREQTGGPKFKPSDLTEKQRQKLMKVYRDDYKAFGKYF